MGAQASKSPTNRLDLSEQEETDADTPTCDGDPRSPSLNIDRTPLQHAYGANSKVTKNVNLAKECFDKFEEVPINPALRVALNEFDPRSPTLDFERTPLSFLIKDPEWVAAHNKMNSSAILDVSLDSSIQVKEVEPKNLCVDLANLSIPDVDDLHETEQVSESEQNVYNGEENSNTCDKASPPAAGLLETNLDYLETDIDIVRMQKCKKLNEKVKQFSVETKTVTIEREINSNKVKEEIVQQVVTEDITFKDLSDKDPRSPSDGIDRTPILIAEKETASSEIKKSKTKKKINSRVKEVMRNNAKLQKNLLYQDIFNENENKIVIKESLLIYEDNIENISPVIKPTLQYNEAARTPLACMMNIDKPQTGSLHSTPVGSINKLSQVKSKIPVRISKSSPTLEKADGKLMKPRLVDLDAENTPPQPRKACWERNTSVIL